MDLAHLEQSACRLAVTQLVHEAYASGTTGSDDEWRGNASGNPPEQAVATTAVPTAMPTSAIDSRRLAAALKLLQSYICLIGGSLNIEQRAEIVTELYDLLCDASEPQEVDRLIAFHRKLSEQLRKGHVALT